MSLRTASEKLTICEVLRQINDILQGDKLHPTILPKLRLAEAMAKRMSKKLYQNNKSYDRAWWDKNPDYERNLKKRLKTNYIA